MARAAVTAAVGLVAGGGYLWSTRKGEHNDLKPDATGRISGFPALTGAIQGLEQLSFEAGFCILPHPDKVFKGGEDAAFCGVRAIGVADGVGGWADRGVDPGLYSKGLCKHAENRAKIAHLTNLEVDSSTLMQVAYDKVQLEKVVGSTTACFASIHSRASGLFVTSTNVGDSGVMIVRMQDKKPMVLFRSKEQQYRFNFPYQLGTGSETTPKEGDVTDTPVQNGDFVILGTDGLFDNVYDSEILGLLSENQNVQAFCNRLAVFARQKAEDRSAATPFADAAQKANLRFAGGKIDDITVLVGKVMGGAPVQRSRL